MGLNEKEFFLRKAREAEKVAASSRDERDCEIWLQIAEEYQRLAKANGETKKPRG